MSPNFTAGRLFPIYGAIMSSSYCREQVDQYLDLIEAPDWARDHPPTPRLLQTLHIHTISTLPYENLSIHYNPDHDVKLDPQSLFAKLVSDKRGRGGFCMEIAIFYNHMLRALGFNAYTAGVRTRPRTEGVPRGDFPGWSVIRSSHNSQSSHTRNHIVNIVTFEDGSQYHDDVAFGGDGATVPLPLIDGLIHENMGTQQIRLHRDWIPTQLYRVETSKVWIYQYRNTPSAAWNSFYSFPGIEFMPLDWGVVNFWQYAHINSHQTYNVLVVKFLRTLKTDSTARDEYTISGKRMLVNGTIKENLGGRTRIVTECESESERVTALRHFFDIKLSDSEILGIQGWRSQL